ncbi:MAG: sulfatase, partial [Gemmatimonadales bacterium]
GRYASHDPEQKPRRIEIGAWSEHSRLPGPALIQLWRDRYDESVQYLDAQIGALLDSLRARGLTGRTLVIVTGDHGEAFGEHGMVHHGGGLYLEQVRIPLILSYPGVLPAGEVSEDPVGLAEISSMIGSLAGLHGGVFDEAPSPVPPGEVMATIVDSVPAVSEADAAPGSPASWQTGRGWVQSLVVDHWHLITMEDGDRELYDLDADPGEVNDLAALPTFRDSIAVLDSLLDDAIPDPEE